MPRRNKTKKQKKKMGKGKSLSFMWSFDNAQKEGLYFPKRRIRISYPSKVKILKRIESQNFHGATEEEINIVYFWWLKH